MRTVKYVRLYADAKGESHFEDVTIGLKAADFAPPAPPLEVAAPFDAERAIIGSAPVGWEGDWHPTPARQFYIQLSGRMEAETSDGERRTIGPGSLVLLEDTTGKGHRSRVVGDVPVTMVFVQLDEERADL